MEAELQTTAEVIDELGGNPRVGELTAMNAKAVWNWRQGNTFPAWTFLILTKALKARGKKAPDRLWAMNPPVKRRQEASS